MSVYLQIAGDPTRWWPANPLQASQLTGQPLSIDIAGPANATLILSGKSESVAVFEGAQLPPTVLTIDASSVYVPTAAGMSAGRVGYGLPAGVDLTSLGNQILAAMRSGDTQAITLTGGGTLVINGATLSFVVLVSGPPMAGGGTMPHD